MGGWDDETLPPGPGTLDVASLGDDWGATPQAPLLSASTPFEDEYPDDAENTLADGAVRLAENPDPEALLIALMALPPGQAPRLDASDVKHLSMPALQVLLAAMRETESAGQRLVIQDPSFALNLAFEAFGFVGAEEPFTVEYS